MAVIWVKNGTFQSSTADISYSAITGVQANDVAILSIECAGNGTITGLTGWTFIGQVNSTTSGSAIASDARLACYWQRATGTSFSSFTITDTGNHTSAGVSVFRGCATVGSPIDGSFQSAGSTVFGGTASPTVAGVTPTTVNTMVFAACALADDTFCTGIDFAEDAGNPNAVTNETLHFNATHLDGSDGALITMTGDVAAMDGTGALTVTLSTAEHWALMLFALKSAEGSGPTATPRSYGFVF